MSAKKLKQSLNKDGRRTFQENFVNVKLKRTVHGKLKVLAKKNYRSMSNQIEVWIANEK